MTETNFGMCILETGLSPYKLYYVRLPSPLLSDFGFRSTKNAFKWNKSYPLCVAIYYFTQNLDFLLKKTKAFCSVLVVELYILFLESKFLIPEKKHFGKQSILQSYLKTCHCQSNSTSSELFRMRRCTFRTVLFLGRNFQFSTKILQSKMKQGTF